MSYGLGGIDAQRLMTSDEEADFLSRHPVVAAQVAETKLFLNVIGYDQILSPPSWYEFDVNVGLIQPAGLTVQDSVYGRVIIYPAPNGNLYFNINVPANVDTNTNRQQVPGDPGASSGSPDDSPDCLADPLACADKVLDKAKESITSMIVTAALVWVAVNAYSSRK